jgi:nitrogenase-associated protein
MPAVSFWWKPGCAGNTRQIRQLEAAGCEVTVRDLLTEAWTAKRLQPFFEGQPVSKWFNTSAPAVKYGEIEIEKLDADAAMALLLANPLLIRRPLMAFEGGACTAGFDEAWLAKQGILLSGPGVGEGCPRHESKEPTHDSTRCACKEHQGDS